MNLSVSNITFGNKIKTFEKDNYLHIREYDDFDNLISYKKKEIQKDRFILSEQYDNSGKITERQHFQYLKNKIIETVSGTINYKRIITKETKESLIYHTEEYISENSSKNYINQIVRNMEGKIISWTNNGKKIL